MELLTRKESWNIGYEHALGETASWFYVQIRDHAKIYGRRDPKSGRVLVPPRSFSDQTLEPTKEWVEVGPGGRIECFTIVYEQFKTLPPPPRKLPMAGRPKLRRAHPPARRRSEAPRQS